VVEQTSFDVAILVQSFKRSLSVPEQYLDDLRSYSPGTRIVVFADELHVSPARSDGARASHRSVFVQPGFFLAPDRQYRHAIGYIFSTCGPCPCPRIS
jgi:hypothetical protein